MDDSLAVLAIYKYYFKEWKECGFSCSRRIKIANSRIGLFLVNYREKQKPIWGDTLNSHSTIVKDYIKDNSVLVFDKEYKKFGFWKIGTNTIEFMDYTNYSNYNENGYINFTYYNARPLTNGNILLFYKNYLDDSKFLLETENRQLKQFEFSGEYEWLSKCVNWYSHEPEINYVNISSIGGKASCIKKNELTNNFELTVNDIVTDSLSSLNSLQPWRGIGGWYGNYIMDYTRSNRIYKIDTLNFKFDSTYIPMWLLGTKFYKSIGNDPIVIYYSTQDLLGTND